MYGVDCLKDGSRVYYMPPHRSFPQSSVIAGNLLESNDAVKPRMDLIACSCSMMDADVITSHHHPSGNMMSCTTEVGRIG